MSLLLFYRDVEPVDITGTAEIAIGVCAIAASGTVEIAEVGVTPIPMRRPRRLVAQDITGIASITIKAPKIAARGTQIIAGAADVLAPAIVRAVGAQIVRGELVVNTPAMTAAVIAKQIVAGEAKVLRRSRSDANGCAAIRGMAQVSASAGEVYAQAETVQRLRVVRRRAIAAAEDDWLIDEAA